MKLEGRVRCDGVGAELGVSKEAPEVLPLLRGGLSGGGTSTGRTGGDVREG